MTVSHSGFSIEALMLPNEDPAELRRLYDHWMAGYPGGSPIEEGLREFALNSLVEKRRIERTRVTVRTDRLRTADLFFEREQEDYVHQCLSIFSKSCSRAMRELLRTAAGCRWCIARWEELKNMLANEGTWYLQQKIWVIQLLGFSACLDQLYLSEPAYTIWRDCLAAQPNPKQADIDDILDPAIVPKGLQDRDVTLWPADPAACRTRLQAIVDRELPRLKGLEEMLRLTYEVPARSEAQQMALAIVTRQDMALLRAEQMHAQAYERATTAFMKARKQAAASCAAVAAPARDETMVIAPRLGAAPGAPDPTPPAGGQTVVGRSEHRFMCARKARAPRGIPAAELDEISQVWEPRERPYKKAQTKPVRS